MAVFSAIASAVTAAATWFAAQAAVTQFAIRIGIAVGTSLLARAIGGGNQPDRPSPKGITTEVQQGADVPRRFILGHFATRGSLVYHNTWGSADVPGDGVEDEQDNAYYTRITAVSDLPVRRLSRVFIDGRPVTLDFDNPDPGGRGYPVIELEANDTDTRIERPEGEDWLDVYLYDGKSYSAWVKFYDGTQETADPFVVQRVSTDERPWTESEVGRGVAYAVTTFLLDREQFQGLPDVVFEIDGVPLFDPALGAVGFGESAPATQIFNILRGFSYGGEWLWGPQGRGAGRVRAEEWAPAVNACNAPVPGAEGMTDAEKREAFGSTTVPQRYRSGIEISVDQEPAEVIENLLSACAGRIAEVGTRYVMQVGDPGAPALTLRDADILSTEGQEFVPFLGISESVNGVSSTYPDPAAAWEVQNAPPLYVPEYEAEDGGRRLLVDAPMSAVPYAEQVQRLQWSVLNEARRARRHSIVLPPRLVGLLPLDYLSWDSDRNGYEDKLFRVDGVSPAANGNVAADLTEVDPSDYDWNASTQFRAVTAGSLTPQPRRPMSVHGFQVLRASVRGPEGERAPAIEIVWARGRQIGVRGIRWQVRVKSTGAIVTTGERADLSDRRALVSEGIGRNRQYEARAIYIPAGGTRVVWTDWVAAYSGDVGLGREDLADDVRERIDAAFDKHDAVLDDAQGTIAELRDQVIASYGDYRLLEGRPSLLDQIDSYLIPTQQSVEDQLDAMAENLTWAIENVAQAGQKIADAGIVTDPDTGAVTISGLHSVEGRVGQVEVDLQAAEASLGLKASYAEVNQAISEALLDPTQIPIIDDLKLRVSTVEADLDAAEGAIALKADTAEIDGINTRLSSAEVDIDSLQSTITLKADSADLTAVQSRLSLAEVQLDTLDGANITQTVQDTRRQTDEIDAAAFNTFNDMWEALRERNTLREGAGLAQSEIYASVNEQFAAEAAARDTLAVRLDGNAAAIEAERRVRISEGEVLAESIAQLEAELTDVNSGVSGNAQALSVLSSTVSQQGNALTSQAQEITDLQASLSDARGGIAGNASAFSGLSATVSDQGGEISSISSDLSTLSGRVGDAEGAISNLASTRVTASGAISAVEQRISASYGDMTALAEAAAFAKATADQISSGYYVRLGDDDVLSFVRTSDGSPATTRARIKSDMILLDGNTTVLGGFQVDRANIGRAAVGTLEIGDRAVTVPVENRAINGKKITDRSWNLLCEVPIERDAGFRTRVDFGFEALSGNAEGRFHVEMRIYRGNTFIEGATVQWDVSRFGGLNWFAGHVPFRTVDTNTSGGTVNYELRARIVAFDGGLPTSMDFTCNNLTGTAVQFKR